MQKSFKEVFSLTNKYIVLLTPLIIFSLVSNVYLAISSTGKVINLLFAIILSALMFGAFIAGWFKMVKLSVSSTLHDKNPNNLMKEFVPGVGEYFLPSPRSRWRKAPRRYLPRNNQCHYPLHKQYRRRFCCWNENTLSQADNQRQ